MIWFCNGMHYWKDNQLNNHTKLITYNYLYYSASYENINAFINGGLNKRNCGI